MNADELTFNVADTVIGLLKKSGSRSMPLKQLRALLLEGLNEYAEAENIVSQAIESVLDRWIVDKVLDYDDNDEESQGKLVWFLRLLSKEESEYLSTLPEEKQALLRILRNSETENRLGAIRMGQALEELHKQGFDLDFVPAVSNRTGDFFRTEGGVLVVYQYLISEDEKPTEYR